MMWQNWVLTFVRSSRRAEVRRYSMGTVLPISTSRNLPRIKTEQRGKQFAKKNGENADPKKKKSPGNMPQHLVLSLSTSIFKVYLFSRERTRKLLPSSCSLPKCPQSWGMGIQSRSPPQETDTQWLEPSLLPLSVCNRRNLESWTRAGNWISLWCGAQTF